jgi:demethylmenaquinone methyltransferase/2-methoxy-6-polyprenyl-1,4-benzoquinol methylase
MKLVASLSSQSPKRILDLACGSGDVSLLLQKEFPSAEVIALDFCRPLLDQAKARGVKKTVEADALNLPFPDQTMDAATLAFGLRNFADRPKGLSEVHRVLQPGGIFALLEFSPPPFPWKFFWNFYLFRFMPWVAQLLTRQGESFRYLAESISRFPTPSALHHELHAAGLKLLFARSMSLGLVRLTVCRKLS